MTWNNQPGIDYGVQSSNVYYVDTSVNTGYDHEMSFDLVGYYPDVVLSSDTPNPVLFQSNNYAELSRFWPTMDFSISKFYNCSNYAYVQTNTNEQLTLMSPVLQSPLALSQGDVIAVWFTTTCSSPLSLTLYQPGMNSFSLPLPTNSTADNQVQFVTVDRSCNVNQIAISGAFSDTQYFKLTSLTMFPAAYVFNWMEEKQVGQSQSSQTANPTQFTNIGLNEQFTTANAWQLVGGPQYFTDQSSAPWFVASENAYVTNTAPGTNYGGSSTLYVSQNFDPGTSNYNQSAKAMTFLRFYPSSSSYLPDGAQITSLQLSMSYWDGSSSFDSVDICNTGTFSENSITWGNMPAIGSTILSVPFNVYTYYFGGGYKNDIINFPSPSSTDCIAIQPSVDSNLMNIGFYSKEGGYANYAPQAQVQYAKFYEGNGVLQLQSNMDETLYALSPHYGPFFMHKGDALVVGYTATQHTYPWVYFLLSGSIVAQYPLSSQFVYAQSDFEFDQLEIGGVIDGNNHGYLSVGYVGLIGFSSYQAPINIVTNDGFQLTGATATINLAGLQLIGLPSSISIMDNNGQVLGSSLITFSGGTYIPSYSVNIPLDLTKLQIIRNVITGRPYLLQYVSQTLQISLTNVVAQQNCQVSYTLNETWDNLASFLKYGPSAGSYIFTALPGPAAYAPAGGGEIATSWNMTKFTMQTVSGVNIFNYWTLQSIRSASGMDITSNVTPTLAGDTFDLQLINCNPVFTPSEMYVVTFAKEPLNITCQLVQSSGTSYVPVTQIFKTTPTNCARDYRIELQILNATGMPPTELFSGGSQPIFSFSVQQYPDPSLQFNASVVGGGDTYFPYYIDLNNSATGTNAYTALWSVNMDALNNPYYDTSDISNVSSFSQVEQLNWVVTAPRDPSLPYINPTATVSGTQVTSYVPYLPNDQFCLNVGLADPEGVVLPSSTDENFAMSYALAQQHNHVNFAPPLSDVLNYSAPMYMNVGGSFTSNVAATQIKNALVEGIMPQDLLYALPQVASYNPATGATEQKLDLYFHYNLATQLAAQNLTITDLSCLNLTVFARVFYDQGAFSWPAGAGAAQLMIYDNATGAWDTLTSDLNVPAASLDPGTIGTAMTGESDLSPVMFMITPASAAPLKLSNMVDSSGNLLFKFEADVQGKLAGQTWLVRYEPNAAIVGAVGLVSANFTAWSAPVVRSSQYTYTNHSGRVQMLNYVPGNYTIDLSYVGTNPGYIGPAAESLAWQLLPRPVNLTYTLPQGAVAGQPAQVALSATDNLTGIAAADCKVAVSDLDLDTSTTTLLGTVLTDDSGQAALTATYPAGNFTFQFAIIPNDGAGMPPYVNAEWMDDFYQPAVNESAPLAVPFNQATMIPRFLGVASDNTFVAGSEVDLLVQFYQQGGAVVPDVKVDVYVNGQFYATVKTFSAVTLNLPNPVPYNVTVVFPGNAWYPQLENITILTGRRAQVSITAISPPSAIPPGTTVVVTATVTDLTAEQAPIPGAGVNFFVENETTGAVLWNGANTTASDGIATVYIPWNATFIQNSSSQIVVFAQVVPSYPTLDAATSSLMLLDYIYYATYIGLKENLTAYYVQSTYNFNFTLTSESGAALGGQPVQVELLYDGSVEAIVPLTTAGSGVASFTYAFETTGTYEVVLAYFGNQSLEQAAATADWTFDVQERPVSLQCSIAPQYYFVGDNATLQFMVVDALTNASLGGQVIHVMEQVEETGDLRFFDILTGSNDTLLWEPRRDGHFNFTLAFPDGGIYQPATLDFVLAPMLRSLSYNCSLGNLAAVSVYDAVPINITVADALNGSAPADPLQVELDIYSLGHCYSYSSTMSPAGVASFSYTVPYAAADSSITFTINVTDAALYPIYDGFFLNYTLPVELIPTAVNFTAVQTAGYAGIPNNLTFSLVDKFGNVLAGQSITIGLYCNGTLIQGSIVTQAGTAAAFSFTGADEGSYSVVVQFAGTSQYQPATGTYSVYLALRSLNVTAQNFQFSYTAGRPFALQFLVEDGTYGTPLNCINSTLSYLNASNGSWVLLGSTTSNGSGLLAFPVSFAATLASTTAQLQLYMAGGALFYDTEMDFSIALTQQRIYFAVNATPQRPYYVGGATVLTFDMYDYATEQVIGGQPFNATIQYGTSVVQLVATSGATYSASFNQSGVFAVYLNITGIAPYNDTTGSDFFTVARVPTNLSILVAPSNTTQLVGDALAFSLSLNNTITGTGMGGQAVAFGYLAGGQYTFVANLLTSSGGAVTNFQWALPTPLAGSQVQFQFAFNDTSQYVASTAMTQVYSVVLRSYAVQAQFPHSISVAGPTTFAFTITDTETGAPLAGVPVTFCVQYPNGTAYSTTLAPTTSAGETSYVLALTPSMAYADQLVISYRIPGTASYNNVTAVPLALPVNQMVPVLGLQYNPASVVPEQAFNLTVTLNDTFGTLLSGRTVHVAYAQSQESGSLNYVVGAGSYATLQLNYPGMYAFTLQFAGENRFAPVTQTFDVLAGKVNSTIILSFLNPLTTSRTADFLGELVNYTLPANLANYTMVANATSTEFRFPVAGAQVSFYLIYRNLTHALLGTNTTGPSGLAYFTWVNTLGPGGPEECDSWCGDEWSQGNRGLAFQAIIQNSTTLNYAASNPIYLSTRLVQTQFAYNASASVILANDPLWLNVTLQDEFGIALQGQVFTMRVLRGWADDRDASDCYLGDGHQNDVLYTTTLTEGNFSTISLMFPAIGQYTISLVFNGTAVYRPAFCVIPVHVVSKIPTGIRVDKSGLIGYATNEFVNLTFVLYELDSGAAVNGETLQVTVTEFGFNYHQIRFTVVTGANATVSFVFNETGTYLIEVRYGGSQNYEGATLQTPIVVGEGFTFNLSLFFVGCCFGLVIPAAGTERIGRTLKKARGKKIFAVALVYMFAGAEFANLAFSLAMRPATPIAEAPSLVTGWNASGTPSDPLAGISNQENMVMGLVSSSLNLQPQYTENVNVDVLGANQTAPSTASGDQNSSSLLVNTPLGGVLSDLPIDHWDEIYSNGSALVTQNVTTPPTIAFPYNNTGAVVTNTSLIDVAVTSVSGFVAYANYTISNDSNGATLDAGALNYEILLQTYACYFMNVSSSSGNVTLTITAGDYSNNTARKSLALQYVNLTDYDLNNPNLHLAPPSNGVTTLPIAITDYLNLSFVANFAGFYIINIRDANTGVVVLSTQAIPVSSGDNVAQMINLFPLVFALTTYEVQIILCAPNPAIAGAWDSYAITQFIQVQRESTAIDLTLADGALQNEYTAMTANLTAPGYDAAFNRISVGVPGKLLKFFLWNGQNYQFLGQQLTDSNGLASIDYNCTVPKATYNVMVEFDGDPLYANSTGQDFLKSLGYQALISVVNNPSAVYGGILDIQAQIANWGQISPAGTYVNFNLTSVGDPTQMYSLGSSAVDQAGFTDFQYVANLPPGAYYLDAYTSYDSVLADSVCRYPATVNITLDPTHLAFLPVTSEGEFVTVPFNQTTQVSAQLTGLNNEALAGESVDFYIENSSSPIYLGTANTTAQGIATLVFATALTPGDYAIQAQFAGNNVSAYANVTQQIAISRVSAALTFTPAEVPFGTPLALVGHVMDAVTGAPVAGAEVEFDLLHLTNEVDSITVTTDSSGAATGVLENQNSKLLPGSYNVTMTLFPTDYPGEVSSAFPNAVTIDPQATTLTLSCPATVTALGFLTIQTRLTDAAGTPIPTQILHVATFFNGSTVDLTTGVVMHTDPFTGEATYTYGYLVPGNYTVDVTYTPAADANSINGGYLAASASANVTVTHALAGVYLASFNQAFFHRGDQVQVDFATADPNAATYIIPVDFFLVNLENPTSEIYLSSSFLYPNQATETGRTSLWWTIPQSSFYTAGRWEIICQVNSTLSLFAGESAFTFDLIEYTHIQCAIAFNPRAGGQHYVREPEVLTYSLLGQDGEVLREQIYDWSGRHALNVHQPDASFTLGIDPATGNASQDVTYTPAAIGSYSRSAAYAGSRFYAPSTFSYDYTVLLRPVILSFDGFADTTPEFPNPHISHRDRQLQIWGHAIDYLDLFPVNYYETDILTAGVDTGVANSSDPNGQIYIVAGTDHLSLRAAGFYLLSLEGMASAIYAASVAPAPDLVMIYEKLTLDLVDSGSGNVFQQNCEINPSVQFIGEDGESVDFLHLLNFYDSQGLADSFLTTQNSGVAYNVIAPGQYSCEVMPAPASLLLFGSDVFPWDSFTLSAGEHNLPYYIGEAIGKLTVQRVALDSDINVAGIQYANNPIVEKLGLDTAYTMDVDHPDTSTQIYGTNWWLTLCYSWLARSVQQNANLIVQLVFLLIYLFSNGGASPADIFSMVLALLVRRAVDMLGGLGLSKGNVNFNISHEVRIIGLSLPSSLTTVTPFGTQPEGNVPEAAPNPATIEYQTTIEENLAFQTPAEAANAPPSQQVSPTITTKISTFVTNLLGWNDLALYQSGLIILFSIFEYLANPAEFERNYNTLTGTTPQISSGIAPLSGDPYSILDAIFWTLWYAGSYYDKFMQGSGLSGWGNGVGSQIAWRIFWAFVIAFAIAELVRYFLRWLIYLAKIQIIISNVSSIPSAMGSVTPNWASDTGQIDYLWNALQGESWFWIVNVIFIFLTDGLPFIVAALFFALILEATITNIASDAIIYQFVQHWIVGVIESMVLDRLVSLLGSLVRFGIGAWATNIGLSTNPLLENWANPNNLAGE